jgi:ligand-binding sensor domain-containing protein
MELFALRQDSVFVLSGSGWSLFHASSSPVTFIQGMRNELFIGTSLNGKGGVLQFGANQSQPNLIQGALLSLPASCTSNGNEYWIGDLVNGLIRIEGNNNQQILPDAPYLIPKGYLHYNGGKLVAPAGFVGSTGIPQQLSGVIDVFEDDKWKNLNKNFIRAMDSLPDIMSAVFDQATGKIIAGSYGGGLAEIAPDGKTTIFKQGSALSPVSGSSADYRVSGLAFDLDRQLWVTNPGTKQPLLIRKKDGAWKKFTIPFSGPANPGFISVDIDNRKWIILQGGGGLVCFDDRGTPDQTNDDQWRLFRQGRGNGNLPSSNVTAITVDKNGFIWVGTDRGVAIIQCIDDLFNVAACEATLPVVRQDNFAGLLLAEEKISDIETDQADRKWITSNNGVWLISADGQKTIHRFTSSNSKLLSDEVHSVAINELTGEVFFLTALGISSYRGEATAPVTEKRKPFIFPNPVPPGYSGTIAFRDLPDRAWVKITELNGKLVYETRSLGGQAVWNGKNLQGARVNSGVYLVYVSEELNQYQVAGKVVFIK